MPRRLFGLILVSLATAACAVQPDPIPAATVIVSPIDTPTATLAPSPTATATPTPSPTPTATPRPEARMSDAAQAVHDGDFDAATAMYQAVIDGPAAADLVEQAQFELAKVRLLAGDTSGAIDRLTQFMQAHPKSERVADAWFELGEAYFAQSDWPNAIDAYQQYLKLRGDLIAAYVEERIGDAYTSLNDQPDAAAAYQAAIAHATEASDVAGLREKLALADRLLQRYDEALAQYDLILSFAQQPAYRAQVMYQAGQTLIDAGQAAKGYDRFLNLVNTYPDRPDAYQALVTLIDAGVKVDEFQRGLVDYHAKQYVAAIAAFNRTIAANQDHADAQYYLGLAYRAAGNIQSARKAFDEVIDKYPDASHWGDAWIDKALAQSIGGDLTGAISTLASFVKQHPTDAQAPDALWRAAGLLESSGDYRRAIDFNLQLQSSYPYDQNASDALFDAGLDAYRLKDPTVAISAWQTLSDIYPLSEYYPASLFWQGKAALMAGRPEQADRWLSMAAQHPLDYFGLRAGDVLSYSLGLPSVPGEFDIDPDAGRAEAEVWLADWLNVPTSTLRTLPASVTADIRYQRGMEFWRLGKTAPAKDEFEALRQANAGDASVLYPLAIYFRDIGLYRSSILCAGEVIRLSPAQTSDQAPVFLARLYYPIYYANLVVPEAEDRHIDPLAVFALMRQESLFEGIATSSAYANGLMQIIPATGVEIAHALGWPNYQQSDLYRPMISVKFGVFYLKQQLDYLDGDMIAAWAAYNGGPGNSARWKQAAGGDVDLFVEDITLPETRTYIERLRENLAMYQRLYSR